MTGNEFGFHAVVADTLEEGVFRCRTLYRWLRYQNTGLLSKLCFKTCRNDVFYECCYDTTPARNSIVSNLAGIDGRSDRSFVCVGVYLGSLLIDTRLTELNNFKCLNVPVRWLY